MHHLLTLITILDKSINANSNLGIDMGCISILPAKVKHILKSLGLCVYDKLHVRTMLDKTGQKMQNQTNTT